MLDESKINPSDVPVGPKTVEFDIPLLQKMMPNFVKRQLNLERKIQAITKLSHELLETHQTRLKEKDARIEKKKSVRSKLFII